MGVHLQPAMSLRKTIAHSQDCLWELRAWLSAIDVWKIKGR